MIVTTTKGVKFKVSKIDHGFTNERTWYYDGRYIRNNKFGSLHRAIVERMIGGKIPKGLEVDHINRKRTDNRRENLRLATPSENRVNAYHRVGKNE